MEEEAKKIRECNEDRQSAWKNLVSSFKTNSVSGEAAAWRICHKSATSFRRENTFSHFRQTE